MSGNVFEFPIADPDGWPGLRCVACEGVWFVARVTVGGHPERPNSISAYTHPLLCAECWTPTPVPAEVIGTWESGDDRDE